MTDKSRREFLQTGGSLAGAGWLSSQLPMLLALGQTACSARDAAQPLANLDAATAADLAAIARQIIPSGDTPGAEEAGVIYFMDGAFGGFMSGAKPFLAEGLAAINSSLPGSDRFADLDDAGQQAVLGEHDQGPLFGMLHFLTLVGMFAMPRHGGNRDHAGWQLLGFIHNHGWQPPFGHYDQDMHDG
ncbi:MAG: gluconate 2-dehydrogenase subunit 3 family protein [Gammaproteobacteria bacterium]|nr:gluconate 2-dehydrogenase subunit 3 family protein [Gammaproteobacteria bacterium]NND59826.1 gluconate 2-dehydrogenase subunit 3 family protein [Gammaproteobacteria bacterium]